MDKITLPVSGHDLRVTQHSKMLGYGSGRDVQSSGKRVYA